MSWDLVITQARRAWRQLSASRKLSLWLLVLLTIAASVAEVFSIGAIVPFLGILVAPERAFVDPRLSSVIRWAGLRTPHELMLPATWIFSIAALVSGALRYALLRAQTTVTYAIGVDFSSQIFERCLYQPYQVHSQRNSSDMVAVVANKSNELVVSLLYPLATIFSSVVLLGAVLFALMIVNPLVTATTVAAFAGIYLSAAMFSRSRLETSSREAATRYSQVVKLIQESLGAIRDILLDGSQQHYSIQYYQADRALRTARAYVQLSSGTPRFVVESLGTAFIAFVAYRLSDTANGFSTAIPTLGAIAIGAQRLIPVVQQVYSSWASIVGGTASVGEALDLLEQSIPQRWSAANSEPLEFRHELRLVDVTFRFAPDLPDVLKGVSLVISKGSRIGIIGRTGSGKSTLLDIVMGLIEPLSGAVTIDGVVVCQTNVREWQRKLAHVPQHVYLADTSVAENIAFGIPAASIDYGRVRWAATCSQIVDVIDAWADGFDTIVGERGVNLSGGQRQRLGLARALYKQAEVIVLDEATSALDADTEGAVMDAIDSLPESVTLIVVAHRLTTLRKCSAIVRMHMGRAELVGTYDDLERLQVGRATGASMEPRPEDSVTQ